MRRFALLLLLVSSGCLSYCQADPILARAARGDRAAIHETGNLGRPRIPSTAERLPRMQEAFDALKPNLESKDGETRIAAVEALRIICERAPDIYRNHYAGLFARPLEDALPEVRWRAAWTVGRLGESSPELRAAAEDKDETVAGFAIEAIGRAHDDLGYAAVVRGLDRPALHDGAIVTLTRLAGRELPNDQAWKDHVAEYLRVHAAVSPVASGDTKAPISS